MHELFQVYLLDITDGSGIFSSSTPVWEIILILLGTALIGYFIRYFSKPRVAKENPTEKSIIPATPQVNEWEVKYKNFQANYEQNKLEWQQKQKSSEDRAKTYQGQLAEIKSLYEKAGTDKADAASKLRMMEAQRNEALDTVQKKVNELLIATENIKAQQEKINSLSSALAMTANIRKEAPKQIIISDEELTKKYEADTAVLKKQLEEKDKRLISLLSKEAAANELQLRNDKMASENKILRNEMASANLDTEAVIEKAQQLKDLQLQVLSLGNKLALANGEATNVKKQLAEQQKRYQQQAGKLNELRIFIGQERNAHKAKINELENELAPFKPIPAEVVTTQPERQQTLEKVASSSEDEKIAPSIEQSVVISPEMYNTAVLVDIQPHTEQNVITETGNTSISVQAQAPEPAMSFPEDMHTLTETEIKEQHTFPVDDHPVTVAVQLKETPVGKFNDLLLVQGINERSKALLENEGIDSWGKLAKTSTATLQTIFIEKGGNDFAAINPKSWPIQAQLLADGKWDAFTSYTKYLIGGVDPAEVKA